MCDKSPAGISHGIEAISTRQTPTSFSAGLLKLLPSVTIHFILFSVEMRAQMFPAPQVSTDASSNQQLLVLVQSHAKTFTA